MFIITGGGSGIGKALALTLASLNIKVLIVGRRAKPLAETAEQAETIDYVTADISTPEGRNSILERTESESSIRGLINNAGIIDPMISIRRIQEQDWRQVFQTNLEAPLFLTQQLLPKLTGARVLNINSGAAYLAVSGWSAYCASKAALTSLTRSFTLECPETAFASVKPGIIDTPMQHKVRHTDAMETDSQNFFIELKNNDKLIAPETVAIFLSWLLLEVHAQELSSQEWDIYDTSHHSYWLKSPHVVPTLER